MSTEAPLSVRRSRWLLLFCFYGLLLTFTVNTVLALLDGESAAAMVVIWLIQSVPLLIFIPGLSSKHLRTHAWLSFVSLLYFIPAVLTAFDPSSLYRGVWLSLLSMGLFSGLVAYIHLVRKHLGGTLH